MESLSDKIVVVVVDKVVIGLFMLAVASWISRSIEAFKAGQAQLVDAFKLRNTTRVEHLKAQIQELYSPLLGMIQWSGNVWKLWPQVEASAPAGSLPPTDPGITWNFLVEHYFLPNNKRMADLIRAKIFLIDSEDLPESFERFLLHEAQMEALHKLWKDKNIPSDHIKITPFPKEIERDVAETLRRLRARYREYIDEAARTP